MVVYDLTRRRLVRFWADGLSTGVFPCPLPSGGRLVLLDDGRIAAAVTQPTAWVDSVDYRLLTLADDTVQIASV